MLEPSCTCGVPTPSAGLSRFGKDMMIRRTLGRFAAVFVALAVSGAGFPSLALAADEAPEVMIKRLSDETLGAIKSDKSVKSGDLDRIMELVDTRIMPNVNFGRM